MLQVHQLASLVFLILLPSCDSGDKETPGPKEAFIAELRNIQDEIELRKKIDPFIDKIGPLIDPAKLDKLGESRTAMPRLYEVCYWLEMARREELDVNALIREAQADTRNFKPARAAEQSESLIRNFATLEKLGCLDESGMDKLRRGQAPTITQGPNAGETMTGTNIIRRSVCPELGNCLFNLEFSETLTEKTSNQISQRQIDLAKKWHGMRLLSEDGLDAIESHRE